MKNVAYTKEYLEQCNNYYNKTLSTGYSTEENYKELRDGISVLSKRNSFMNRPNPKDPQIIYRYQGSENTIFHNNAEIYSYRTIHGFDFPSLFVHQNGHEYLFHKRDLYGYSILDLNEMQEFHYYPAASLPFAENETFIWCEVFYNPINNIIAVSGCFWVYPYGVILADFADPLKSSSHIEKYGYMEEIYQIYPDYEFSAWDGTDLILFNCDEPEKEKVIKSNKYMAWFKKK